MISSILNLAGPDLLMILAVASVFLAWMLIDCAMKETVVRTRIIWLLVILFFPWGTLIYLGRKLSRAN
jgi:hypothetical protein